MGANSTQGIAVAMFLVAFTAMPLALVWGGVVMFLIGLALFVASIMMFLKCKPWEFAEGGGPK